MPLAEAAFRNLPIFFVMEEAGRPGPADCVISLPQESSHEPKLTEGGRYGIVVDLDVVNGKDGLEQFDLFMLIPSDQFHAGRHFRVVSDFSVRKVPKSDE